MPILRASNIPPPPGSLVNPTHQLGNGVAYWLTNDGSGKQLTDAGPYRLHGALNSMVPATAWVPTENGIGLKYDGIDDHVRVAEARPLDIPGNAVTLSAWFNKKGDHAPSLGGPIIWRSHTSDPSGNYSLRHDHTSGQLDFIVYTSSSGVLSVTTTINNDQWYHVVGVYNGSTQILYLNGVQIGSRSHSGNLRTGATKGLGIASKANGNEAGFNGIISNISIHPRAFTADEVSWLYHEPYSMIIAPNPARFFSVPAVGYVPYPHKSGLGGGIGQIHGGKAA